MTYDGPPKISEFSRTDKNIDFFKDLQTILRTLHLSLFLDYLSDFSFAVNMLLISIGLTKISFL